MKNATKAVASTVRTLAGLSIGLAVAWALIVTVMMPVFFPLVLLAGGAMLWRADRGTSRFTPAPAQGARVEEPAEQTALAA